jgi:Protein of unknown function (DUF3135)
MNFDFDEWAELYRTDQAAFEERRREAIEQVIGSSSGATRARLLGLQFRIDMECRRAKTPLGRCIRISAMMWESFAQLRDALNGLSGHADSKSEPSKLSRPPSKVIAFKPRVQSKRGLIERKDLS